MNDGIAANPHGVLCLGGHVVRGNRLANTMLGATRHDVVHTDAHGRIQFDVPTRFYDKPAYLHVIVTGENTRENVTRYLEEVLEESTQRGYSKILIEEHLEGATLEDDGCVRDCFRGSPRSRLASLIQARYSDHHLVKPADFSCIDTTVVSAARLVRAAERG